MSLRFLFRVALVTLAVSCYCVPIFSQATAPPKRRIAVLNFEYHAVDADTLTAMFGGDQDIGKGIAALFINDLVQDGTYTVVEYAALDKVLAEQDFSKRERFDPIIATRVGHMLGVDAILIGSVTRFGPEHHGTKTSGNRSPFALSTSRPINTIKSKAIVELSVRLIEPITADTFASFTASGISNEEGAFVYANFRTAQGNFDFTSSRFAGTVLGEATRNAVQQASQKISALAGSIPIAKYSVIGLVADVSGNELTLNVGAGNGLRRGDVLQVQHVTRVIVIPLPGGGISEMMDPVGSATVTHVDASSSLATFSGTGAVTVGDTVRSLP
jgi:curli biogenesis system outer membrane secretion channel CsgG